jgi:hypothetical protein
MSRPSTMVQDCRLTVVSKIGLRRVTLSCSTDSTGVEWSRTGLFVCTTVSHSGRTNRPAAAVARAFSVWSILPSAYRSRSENPAFARSSSGVSKYTDRRSKIRGVPGRNPEATARSASMDAISNLSSISFTSFTNAEGCLSLPTCTSYFESGAQFRKKPTSPGMPFGKLIIMAFSL